MNHPADSRDTGAANLRFARALFDELHAAGVVTAVVCPGSRSAPLALAVGEQAGLAHTVHIDERNAAFHALGHAKATGRPVALICTSGTAGANFLPAIAEACHARVPLLVLTADRPPELRAWGAAQGRAVTRRRPAWDAGARRVQGGTRVPPVAGARSVPCRDAARCGS